MERKASGSRLVSAGLNLLDAHQDQTGLQSYSLVKYSMFLTGFSKRE